MNRVAVITDIHGNLPALEASLAAIDAEVLVFGHTHKPWVREHGGVLFVNCGSVGKPKDGDRRGAFAILELDASGGVRASIERGSTSPPTSQAAHRRDAAARRLGGDDGLRGRVPVRPDPGRRLGHPGPRRAVAGRGA